MFPPRHRGQRAVRIIGVTFTSLIILVLLAAGAFVVFFDPNSLKPRIVDYVRRETGRDIDIKGRIGFSMSLTPTIQAADITFANLTGGTSPEMATVARIEAQISLLPLISHRLVITRLVLLQPHILLERNSSGEPNWRFTKTGAAGQPSSGEAGTPPAPRTDMRLAVQSVHIRDGEIRLRPMGAIGPTVIAIPRLDATSASIGSPIGAKADLSINGTDLSADITTGSLARLQDRTATTPWPVNVTLEGSGMRFAMAGDIAHPDEGKGYQATIDGELHDDNPFRTEIAQIAPMRDVRFIGHIANSPTGAVVLTKLSLRGAGTGEQTSIPDLRIASFALTADDMNDPIHADLRGDYRDGSFTVAGTVASVAGYIAARAGGPFPLDLTTQYAGAQLHAKGQIGSYPVLSNADIGVDITIPDLINLSTVSRVLLPSLKDVTLSGHIMDADGSLFHGIAFKGFKLGAPIGDLSGDIEWIYFGRPSLRATIGSEHLDVTGLGSVLRASLPTADAALPKPAPDPTLPTAQAGGQAATPSATDQAPPDIRLLFSNRPIPVGFIRDHDLDIVVHLNDLRDQGADYTDVVAHAFDRNGDMLVEPISAKFGTATIDGRLRINAMNPTVEVQAALNGPAVAIAPTLAAFGLPPDATGTANVKFALQGVGDTPHRLAASLGGGFTVSIADAELGNTVLTQAFGDALRGVRLPDSFGTGRTRLRCFAMRGEVAQGDVKLPTLVLDSSNLVMQGSGDVNLGDERIALRVRPIVKVGGKDVSVPMRIGGTLTAPRGSVDALAAIAGFGERGLNDKDKGGDPCPAALASVQSVQPGPEAAVPTPQPAARPTGEAPKRGPTAPARGSKG